MLSLYRKEITGFFSSLTGYVVIIVFLLINGLFTWVFPGNLNLLDGGFSTLDTMFFIAPWVFLFLIPAITMRTFAEEKKEGTLDLLFTRPLTNVQIILAKYFAAITLAFAALIPTLIYYFTVIKLGDPVGNIDHGGTWGSYIGLLMLAAIYCSIGIFSSALTDNIIVSFLLGVFICFVAFSGFQYIGNLAPGGSMGNMLINLGIDAHYQSISRGVIDSRDLLYFLSAITVFILFTNLKLSGKRW